MELERARTIAQQVTTSLAPACRRIEIAGSIRRDKPEVKDVEIVFEPAIGLRQVDLFDSEPYALTDDVLADLVSSGVLRPDDQVKRWGPKYKRCIHVAGGLAVELFAADAENWGYVLALRTGPAEFNKILVSRPWAGGALSVGFNVDGGYVYHGGRRCVVATEELFFATLQLPCWPPSERTPERLAAYLAERNRPGISREMKGENHAPRT